MQYVYPSLHSSKAIDVSAAMTDSSHDAVFLTVLSFCCRNFSNDSIPFASTNYQHNIQHCVSVHIVTMSLLQTYNLQDHIIPTNILNILMLCLTWTQTSFLIADMQSAILFHDQFHLCDCDSHKCRKIVDDWHMLND